VVRRALLALLILAAAEIYLLLRLGEALGAAATLGLLVAAAVVGYSAARAQGLEVLRRWREAALAGAKPEDGLTDGLLVLLGGALLVLPGVISDVLGLLLLVPPVRRRVAARLRRRAEAWVASGSVRVGTIRVRDVDAPGEARLEVIDVEGHAVEEDRPERLLDVPHADALDGDDRA
jgi:UPF0716 protein FxsA